MSALHPSFVAPLIMGAFSLFGLLACQPDAEVLPRMNAVDQVIQAYDSPFAGVVLLGDETGFRHAGAYGDVVPDGDPHQVNSEWRWASVTKMIVSMLTLQQVEAGKLTLDAPISDVWPNVPDTVRTVTARQLLSHTSGVNDPDLSPVLPGTTVPEWATLDVADTELCYAPPLASPGERFDYNACDFIILEDLLEQITWQRLPELIKERIVEPFGLTSIRFVDQPGDDAAIAGTKDGEVVVSPLQLAALRGDAAVVGEPRDLLALTHHIMAGDIVSEPALLDAFGAGNPDFGYVALGVWGYEATLPGCDGPVKLIERQGHLTGTKILTLLAPDMKRSLVAMSNRDETNWGWIWQGSGLTHDLATLAFCNG